MIAPRCAAALMAPVIFWLAACGSDESKALSAQEAAAMPAAGGQILWLVTAPSGGSLQSALATVTQLGSRYPGARILGGDECGMESGYFVAMATAASREEAEAVAAGEEGAGVERCQVAADSLLALGLPLIHPSIHDLPEDVVNWTEEDMVSGMFVLDTGSHLVVERSYDPEDASPLEGQVLALYVVAEDGKRVSLEDNCWGFGGPQVDDGVLAYQCGTEMAAANILHVSRVYSLHPVRLLHEEQDCRDPRIQAGALVCDREAVGADGDLTLEETRVPLD